MHRIGPGTRVACRVPSTAETFVYQRSAGGPRRAARAAGNAAHRLRSCVAKGRWSSAIAPCHPVGSMFIEQLGTGSVRLAQVRRWRDSRPNQLNHQARAARHAGAGYGPCPWPHLSTRATGRGCGAAEARQDSRCKRRQPKTAAAHRNRPCRWKQDFHLQVVEGAERSLQGSRRS